MNCNQYSLSTVTYLLADAYYVNYREGFVGEQEFKKIKIKIEPFVWR
jgi:hypothetical protein